MVIEEEVPLAPFSTWRIGGKAAVFMRATSTSDLKEAEKYVRDTGNALSVLGGGSNTLFGDKGFDGLVLKIEIPGIDWKEDQGSVVAVVGAGVSWDEFVAEMVSNNLCGLENLSGIPGTVGASPIQNIGAYGKEVASTIEWVEVFDRVTKKVRRVDPRECRFGYRESVFKRAIGSSLIITRVAFRLSQKFSPSLGYADLKEYFSHAKSEPTLQEVRDAILAIRAKKFPSLYTPTPLGTAGSFFKNPIIDASRGEALKRRYPDLPTFPTANGGVKVSAAWLIDRVAGLKGYREGGVRAFEHQALVIVAEGHASASDVIAFAKTIMNTVKEKTDIELEPEVRFVGCVWS